MIIGQNDVARALSGSSIAIGDEAFSDGHYLISIEELQRRLNVSRGTIYNLMKAGQIATVKVGRRSLVTREELARFLSGLRPAA